MARPESAFRGRSARLLIDRGEKQQMRVEQRLSVPASERPKISFAIDIQERKMYKGRAFCPFQSEVIDR